MNKLVPNLIIFRMPVANKEQEDNLFAQISLDEKFNLVDGSFKMFSVAEGDSYLSLPRSMLVIARSTENGSINLCNFGLSKRDENDQHGTLAEIWNIGFTDMNEIVPSLVDNYLTSAGHTE